MTRYKGSWKNTTTKPQKTHPLEHETLCFCFTSVFLDAYYFGNPQHNLRLPFITDIAETSCYKTLIMAEFNKGLDLLYVSSLIVVFIRGCTKTTLI